METHIFDYLLGGISVIAWAYFLFDRSNMIKRLDKHSNEIDFLKKENSDLRGSTSSLINSETLRTRLLDEQLGNLKMMLQDIKSNQEKQDNDIEKMKDKFIDALINKQSHS